MAETRFFDLSDDMLCIVDGRTSLLVNVNAACERTLGWRVEQMVGRPFMEWIHPDDHAATAARAARLTAEAQSPGDFDNRWRCADGSYRRLRWSVGVHEHEWYCVAKDVTAAYEADQAVRRSVELHRTLSSNLPDTTVYLLDRELRIMLADGEAIRRLPWLDENLFRGRRVTDLGTEVPDDVLRLVIGHYRATLAGERRTFELASDGLVFAVDSVPIDGDDGTVESVLVVMRDVTAHKRAVVMLGRRAAQQQAVAELGRFALKSRDSTELVREALRTATSVLDVGIGGVLSLDEASDTLTVEAAVGIPPSVVGHRLPLTHASAACASVRTGEPAVVEYGDSDGDCSPPPVLAGLGVRSSLTTVISVHGSPWGAFTVHSDRSGAFSAEDASFLTSMATLIAVGIERHRDEEITRHAALHDPLTALPNRTLARDRLSHALARRRRDGIEVAVLAIDLDRFKLINDSLGHAAGDEVLIALAPRLMAALRPTDTVARLGGDEFVVICPDIDGILGATQVAERLTAAIARPLALDSGEHFFTASVGVTLAAANEDTPDSLLRDADAALYRAKERGRGRYELFDANMRARLIARVEVEAELRRALAEHEIGVWYQPVVCLATGRTVSHEALARWQHPDRGVVSPADFITIAEESGLIDELGFQVLELACRQTAEWQQDHPGLGLSVNISGRQVVNPMFPAEVAAIARRSGIRPGTLALEITESVLMDEADSPAAVFGLLQEQGVTLILDDFGTGYSSLARLKSFSLDVLKIDRSFVAGVDDDDNDRAIVKATIDMAHAVGLTVVAEGVETPRQRDRLRALGCDRAQGYLYARPQPAAATHELLAGSA